MNEQFTLSLKDALLLVMSGGGGGVVYWLMEKVKWLKNLAPEYKRYASLALSALLPVAAWLVMLLFGYESPPTTWVEWAERIFTLAAPALIVSGTLHGRIDLRKKANGVSEGGE